MAFPGKLVNRIKFCQTNKKTSRRRKTHRTPLVFVHFSYFNILFFFLFFFQFFVLIPLGKRCVELRGYVYRVHAFMHIIQEQETCTLCTYDALDRHADKHTHTIAVSGQENAQRQRQHL